MKYYLRGLVLLMRSKSNCLGTELMQYFRSIYIHCNGRVAICLLASALHFSYQLQVIQLITLLKPRTHVLYVHYVIQLLINCSNYVLELLLYIVYYLFPLLLFYTAHTLLQRDDIEIHLINQ